MTRTIYFYKLTFKESGKSYIGQTYDLEKRFLEHRYSGIKCRKHCLMYIWHAIGIYGKDSFSAEHIGTLCDSGIASTFESMLIYQHRTYAPYGYNVQFPDIPGFETKDPRPGLISREEYDALEELRFFLRERDILKGRKIVLSHRYGKPRKRPEGFDALTPQGFNQKCNELSKRFQEIRECRKLP